jgi:hypothetical protein
MPKKTADPDTLQRLLAYQRALAAFSRIAGDAMAPERLMQHATRCDDPKGDAQSRRAGSDRTEIAATQSRLEAARLRAAGRRGTGVSQRVVPRRPASPSS